MSWSPELFGGCEAAKIAPHVVRYLQGRALDIGSGPGKVWPPVIGIDPATEGGRPVTDMAMDGTDLSMFADGSHDAVFSSFLLQQVERSRVPGVLREWARVLKVGGHLVLYLPDGDEMPADIDPLQRWTIHNGDIEHILWSGALAPYDPDKSRLEGVPNFECGWEVLEREVRHGDGEYGLFLVLRKAVSGWVESVWERNPDGMKRALVVRYGAIGDAIVAASVFPGLKAQGYHVTVNCRPSTKDVLLHDPHVDDFLVQADDFVPNSMLGPYWRELGERYDRVINLSESVEGLLLALPGRLNHSYSDEARRAIYGGINYLEHTHNIAGVPHDFAAKFYPTADENKWAAAVRRRMSGPVIVWVINGSSMHKVYPWVQVVGGWLLERTPAHLVLYADPGVGTKLQEGIMTCLRDAGHDMSRVHGKAGLWKIRQSLTFAQHVDCVVGPETGPMNAVGMEPVPKVIYLSHSSAENLTKHWINTTTLEPDREKAPCSACHRLHFDWTFCHKDESTGAALCASSISPREVFEAIALNIGARKAA